MRQSLPFRARGRDTRELRHPAPACSLCALALVPAFIWLGPIPAAQAQRQGALQVSAKVVSVQPSRIALKQALDPAIRSEGNSLVWITRTVVPSDDPIRKSRGPRAIVTIAFVRN
jgi:hypothetical protein